MASNDQELRDQCGIFKDNDWGSIVKGFNVMRISATRNARVIAAPVETGQMSFDNKVVDPLRVSVEGIIEIEPDGAWESTKAVGDINKMLADRSFNFYSVSDGENFYNNLILQECPAIRDVKQVDFLVFTLTFVEALLVQKQAEASSSNSENSNFRRTGTGSV